MRKSLGSTKPTGAMKVTGRSRPWQDPSSPGGGALLARLGRHVDEAEQERTRWDPKDGELCPGRSKPEETLVEDRRGSDVQIDRPTRV